jgi:hypothetical protein
MRRGSGGNELPPVAAALAVGCRTLRIPAHEGLLVSANTSLPALLRKTRTSGAIGFMPSQMIKQDLCQPSLSVP